MKVIIIKKCKDGNINDVIEVSDGYAINFLIKQKMAIPFNSKTKWILEQKINKINDKEKEKKEFAKKIKNLIEDIKLVFKLKSVNNVFHGSVTRKQILKELFKKGIKLDSNNIENVKIKTLGITKVNIKLYKEINVKLKIEVLNDE